MTLEVLTKTFFITFLIQIFFFIFAYILKTDKVTDLAYGLGFLTLSLYLFLDKSTFFSYQVVLVVMISIWAIRLASYLFIRILRTGRDKRFDGIRESFFKFLGFWILQTFAIWIIMQPSIVLLNLNEAAGIKGLSFLGIAIWFLGIIVEAIADYQKFSFKNKRENEGKWVSIGLWKYSRHPNYFGEILCWWGIFLFALPYLKGLEFISLISPIFITYLLIFVSGVPTLERKYNELFKGNAEYEKYKRNTNLLLPLHRKIL